MTVSDLEVRLNPRVVASLPRGGAVAVAVERLSPGERALLEPLLSDGEGMLEGPMGRFDGVPGPVGALLRAVIRRALSPSRRLRIPGRTLDFGGRPRVMGVLNVTPDSFSDGGAWLDPERALRHARAMVREGADLIDVGGESTRPGARAVPAAEELRRVLPVVEALARERVLVSIDTSKASVAAAAFRAGARILNDVTALRGDPAMAHAAARAGAAVILMHMRGSPRTMQRAPRYGDVVAEICRFLRLRLRFALSAGIPGDKILLDPGIGFGKRPRHNVEILRRLDEFRSLGCPLAVGSSRKRFIGHYLGREVGDRLPGTAATVAAAILRGADVVRVHDVREMADVARMAGLMR